MCTKSIIKLDTAEEKISELDRQIKVHREKGLEIIEKRVRERRGTMKRCSDKNNQSISEQETRKPHSLLNAALQTE